MEAFFFDFGDTLARLKLPVPELWLVIGRELGLGFERTALVEAITEADQTMGKRLYEFRGRMHEFWRAYDDIILSHFGIRDPDGGLARAIDRRFEEGPWFEVFSDVPETLASLRQRGVHLGIVSNNTDDLLGRLQRLGLDRFFDAITYSQEVAAEKPDPAVFRLALQRAGCAAHEAVHVGNSYEHDVLGARVVGITPVLVDRENRRSGADCLRVLDLREVLRLFSSA